jgi:hypothetical protein
MDVIKILIFVCIINTSIKDTKLNILQFCSLIDSIIDVLQKLKRILKSLTKRSSDRLPSPGTAAVLFAIVIWFFN